MSYSDNVCDSFRRSRFTLVPWGWLTSSLLKLSQITRKFLSQALFPASLEESLIALSVLMPLVTAYFLEAKLFFGKKNELGRTGKMARQVKVPIAKSDNLGSVSETHVAEGENHFHELISDF